MSVCNWRPFNIGAVSVGLYLKYVIILFYHRIIILLLLLLSRAAKRCAINRSVRVCRFFYVPFGRSRSVGNHSKSYYDDCVLTKLVANIFRFFFFKHYSHDRARPRAVFVYRYNINIMCDGGRNRVYIIIIIYYYSDVLPMYAKRNVCG